MDNKHGSWIDLSGNIIGITVVGLTSYFIVKQIQDSQFEVVNDDRLSDYSGIFTAKIAATKVAIFLFVTQGLKTLICSDSLSAIRALIKNHNGIL